MFPSSLLLLHSSRARPPHILRLLHHLHAMDSRHDLLFDADAHHSDRSDTSSDTIEMAGLEEIPVTPARRNDYAQYDGSRDSDDESDSDDAGEQALLGAHSRTRGRERPQDGKPTVFHQVKRIVIEVSFL